MNNDTATTHSLLYIHFCVLLLGGTALFAKLISLPPDLITFYRSLFGGGALVFLILITRSRFRLETAKEYGFMILTGILTGCHWVTYFHSIQISTVAVGILSLYTFPVMTSVMEPVLNREKLRKGPALRTLAVFSGIFLIIPDFQWENQAAAGVLWGLVSAFLFSLRNITVKKQLTHIPGITTMGYQLGIISAMLAPFISFPGSSIMSGHVLRLVLLGVVFTAVPHVLLVLSLRHLKASTASLVLCLHPMYSIFFAAILISEIPPAQTCIGGILIFGTAVYESIRVRGRQSGQT